MNWTEIGQQSFFGLTNGMAYALFAIGLSLIWGIIGIINLAHGELYMLGGMLAWVLTGVLGLDFFLAALITIFLTGIIGLVCNRIAVQPLLGKPNLLLATFLSTLGMSMIFSNGTMIIFGDRPRRIITPFLDSFLVLGDIRLGVERIVMFGIALSVVVALHAFLNKTMTGKIMRATSQHNVGAMLVGINTTRTYALGFAVASGLAGLAGVLLSPIWYAYPYMGQFMLLKGFVIAIVSGLGSILGCVIIGVSIGLAESLFGHFVSVYYREAFTFIIMILFLLFRPAGLFGK